MLKIIRLILGVFACSTAIIMIKASDENPLLIASYRLFIAAIILTPLYLNELKKYHEKFHLRITLPSIIPGIFLGFHFLTWVFGGRMTYAVNASLIVNMVPIIMPIFVFLLANERINKYEIIGTVLGVIGIIILGINDFHISKQSISGDIICFISMLFLAFYLALAKKNQKNQSLYLYIVPLYYIAGIFCFIISLFFINPIKIYSFKNILFIFGLGIIPTVIGHSILNKSMQSMRSQVVSIVNLGQFIFAGIMAFFFFNETPKLIFYISVLFVISGSVLVIKLSNK